MATNISERGFEDIIVGWLTKNNGYELGTNETYNKDYALDEGRLFQYLKDTQPELVKEFCLLESPIERKKFLDRLDSQLSDKGVIEILRNGLRHKHAKFELYQFKPSEGNATATEMYAKNIFSITRQLHYSSNNNNSLDIVIFLNGLPLITIELKNHFTRQSTSDAVRQYMNDRDSREKIFNFKRCLVHFAVDDETIMMCTKLAGKESRFMPFNKGYNDGAGNPPNDGIKTDYLWKEILTKAELSNILENYAQIITEENEHNKKKTATQIFPRYHQLKVVKMLLAVSAKEGVGHRYLIQHSAGSGKSNSIAWLARQLVTLHNNSKKVFDTVLVVTDRINLDRQIRNTIKQFTQVSSTVGWASSSSELNALLDQGKSIIITIVHKFQEVARTINESYRNRTFAIIIDEAHSSQNGSLALKMNQVVSGINPDAEEDLEDKINAIIEGKRVAENASYFAFTATPKNKTLELFGKVMTDKNGRLLLNEDGTRRYEPHDIYSMKQAIEEGFILDVLKNYTPYQSYYRIVKTAVDEKYFDKKSANSILRRYADKEPLAIREKAGIIVEHFYNVVRRKIQGKARAMVVTSGIKNAIDYFFAITNEFKERKSQFKVVIAFSGEYEYNDEIYTESKLNGFPSAKIESNFREEPYRILVVADKFQTGYDEPLLQTMYVDKKLLDIKAVQTLSRLNRCATNKADTCILDFVNEPYDIKKSFESYYKTTMLFGETDPNRLNELITSMNLMEVYSASDIEDVVVLYLNSEARNKLDPIINKCVENYNRLDMDSQIQFKSNAKAFIRTYNFLAAIMPRSSSAWEKLSIFLTLLVTKLPHLKNDNEESIIENVNLENYRAVAQETLSIVLENLSIVLENENAVVKPAPLPTDVIIPVPEQDTLTHILTEFHKLFGDQQWTNHESVDSQIKEILHIAQKDSKVQNAIANSDEQNVRSELERAVSDAINLTMTTGREIYMAYNSENRNKLGQQFNSWLNEIIFQATYATPK